jgi:C4-dicarboxylate-specific signal transduction histidine kinase
VLWLTVHLPKLNLMPEAWIATSVDTELMASISFLGAGALSAILLSVLYRSQHRLKLSIAQFEAEQREELKASTNRLVQASKLSSLGEMAAGIAHEINNPLAIVDGSIRLLRSSEALPAKSLKHLETIQRAVDRMCKIVMGLKRFSRSGDGLQSQGWHRIDRILAEVETLTRHRAVRAGAELSFNCSTERELFCNDLELEQVLVNLVNNALDAAKSRPGPWVRVEAEETKLGLVVRVRDSGPGVPTDSLEKIFTPFFTTKQVGEGTGLGLSISKGLVETQGGTLRLDQSGAHTCFEVVLPLTKSFGPESPLGAFASRNQKS